MCGFYLSCPSATFALQDGCSVPREWPAAKGLFKSAFETLLNGEIGVPGEKPLGERERTRNKLNPHIASTPGFEHGPQRFHHFSTFAPHARLRFFTCFRTQGTMFVIFLPNKLTKLCCPKGWYK